MEVLAQEIDWSNFSAEFCELKSKLEWRYINPSPHSSTIQNAPLLGLMMKILLYASDVIRILTFMHTISYSEWRFITSVMINTKRQYCQYPILFRGNGNDGTSYWYLYILCHIRKCIILFAVYFHMAYFN